MTAVADSVDIAGVGRLLRQRHEETAEQLRGLRAQARSVFAEQELGAGDAADVGTLALEAAEQAMVATALEEQLKRLDAAMERLEAGTFGVCGRCRQQVPLTRLQVMPWATHCVPCQSIVDRQR